MEFQELLPKVNVHIKAELNGCTLRRVSLRCSSRKKKKGIKNYKNIVCDVDVREFKTLNGTDI